MSSVQIVTLDRAADAAALEDYTSSYNMRGITIELTVVVRPATLIRTVTASLPTDAQLPAALLRVRRALNISTSCLSASFVLVACGLSQSKSPACPPCPHLSAGYSQNPSA